MSQREKKNAKTGPEPERLKIEGDWAEAVKKALEKEPPNKSESDDSDDDSPDDIGC